MGVRRVKNSGGNITGTFPSLKMRDLLFFLEYDTSVVRYQAQPFVIAGSSADGAAHTYIPDFQVIRTDCQEIVECKPTARLNERNSHPTLQMALQNPGSGQPWERQSAAPALSAG